MTTWSVTLVCGLALSGAVAAVAAVQDRTTLAGVYTEAQAAEGEALYDGHCAGCHMPDLDGGEDAPPLAGPVFSGVWSGRPLAALVGRMQARMPMEAPGSLGRPAYTAITAYILRRNGLPAGPEPLAADAGALGQIRYVPAP